MKIAVNTRFLIRNRLEGIGWFTYETMKRLVRQHPEHTFYFLFDRPYEQEFLFAPHVCPMVLFPPARHPLLWYWWFEFSVPRALKKIKPDLFISPDGFLSLSAHVPTLLVVHDLAFEHYPQFVKRTVAAYYRFFSPRYCRKAAKIIAVSEATKNDLIALYHIDARHIVVAYNGVRENFIPLSESDQAAIKNQFTRGKNYFIYVGSLHPRKNIVNLLKAFDRFKEQSASDFMLVLAGARGWMLQDIDATLNAMRYREAVVLTGHLDAELLAKIVGSAFALVYVSLYEGFGLPVAEAMKCGVPVITSNISSMPEVAGDAGLLVNPYDIDDIAQAMMRLYTDNQLWKQCAESGLKQADQFSWDNTTRIIWQTAQELLKNR